MKKRFLFFLTVVLLIEASALPAVIQVSMRAKASAPSAMVQLPGQDYPGTADTLSILFIRVGKADAILIHFQDNAYLIDTGEKVSLPHLFGALNLFGLDSLTGVFLTHPHGDHMGGTEALARHYGIGRLYSAAISENKKSGENKIEELARDLSLSHRKLYAGESLPLAEGMHAEVLGPLVPDAWDDNDNSLILKLNVYGRTMLFTGDLQFRGEDALMQSGADIAADVLKVGNHGNPDATSEQFAAAVSPVYSIISTDRTEDPDSANERVLKALERSTLYITEDFSIGVLLQVDQDGTIKVSNPRLPEAPPSVAVTGVDRDTQTVTLGSKGPDLDISGFMILSQRGNELFVFPDGSWLPGGGSVTVSSMPGADYLWPDESRVWHPEKDDRALLFDRFGRFLSRWD